MKTLSTYGSGLLCLLISFFLCTKLYATNPVVQSAPNGYIWVASPTVNITNPANNSFAAIGSSIALTATVTTPIMEDLEVDYYDGNTFVGWSLNPPFLVADTIVASGTHSFTAVATDYFGQTGVSGSIQIIAVPPPLIQITSPQSNALSLTGTNVILSATASAPGRTISNVCYYQEQTAIGSGSGPSYNNDYYISGPGLYQFYASAIDNQGLMGNSQTVTLTAVNNLGVLITSPTNGVFVGIGSTILLTGTAVTSSGSISKIDYYSYSESTGLSTLIGSGTVPPCYPVPYAVSAIGTPTFYAVATNSGSQTASSPEVSVNALIPPVVTLTSPPQNSLFFTGTTITISANASAAGRDISEVAFYDGSTCVGSAGSLPYRISIPVGMSGTHSLTAVATDNRNISVTSQPIVITAVTWPLIAASVTSPANNAYIEIGDNITLTSSVIDSSGTITGVTYFDGTTSIGSSVTAPYTVSYSVTSGTGPHSITVVASSAYTSATSNAITVNVLSAASAYADPDRDGYPNIFEYTHGTDPENTASTPTPDFIVDQSGTYGTYTSIQAAINAVTQDYQVISVLPGTYNENIAVSSSSHKLMLVSTGAASTIINGVGRSPVVTLNNSSVLNGFTITSGSSISAGTAGAVQIRQGSPLLTDCVITGNQAPSGSAIYSSGSNPVLLNCTVTANTTGSTGASIVVASGSMSIINSIVWDSAAHVELGGSAFAVSFSDVSTGSNNCPVVGASNLNANPIIGSDGHILSGLSPCIGKANTSLAPLTDMDGEMRPAVTSGTSDIGADEFICSGTSGLANWWIDRYFNGIAPNPSALVIGGSLTNLQAFQDGIDPLGPGVSGTTQTSATVSINPVVTLTSPPQNALFFTGTTIAIAASVTTAQAINEVAFYDGTTVVGIATSKPYTVTYTIPVGAWGPHSLSAVASGASGISVTSNTVQVTAIISQPALLAEVISPVTNTYIENGDSITLTGSAIDSFGTITGVSYLDGTNSIGWSGTAPYSVSYQVSGTGTHFFTAVVSDTASYTGALITSATSNPVMVHVLGAGTAYADDDRDGYPNIFEYTHGTDPENTESTPAADFVVDQTLTYGSYASIQSAINAVTEDYQIILVMPGTYQENITLSSPGYKVLIISASGAASTIISGTGDGPVVTFNGSSVLNGFTITGGSSASSGTAGAVQIEQGSPYLTDCVITENQAPTGAAIFNTGGNPTLLNCTVTANTTGTAGATIQNASGSMSIVNSIIWDTAASMELSGSSFAVSYSDVRGYCSGSNNLNANPMVGSDGHLLSGSSPCIGAANTSFAPLIDMDGEARPALATRASDIGADEFTSTDGSGLADWWENLYFSGSSVSPNAIAPRGYGVTNLQAFQQGLNPLDPFNGESAYVTIQSGNGQVGVPGQPVSQPLIVSVTDSRGNPFVFAPVDFLISGADGAIALTNVPGVSSSNEIVAVSDTNGNAEVCLVAPSVPDFAATLSVSALTAQTNSVSVGMESVSLVGLWPLAETSGTIAHDQSGIGNNGTLMSAPQNTTVGCDGSSALVFNGTTQYVQIGDSTASAFRDNAVSITAWVRLGSNTPLAADTDIYPVVFKGSSGSSFINFCLRSGSYNGLCVALSDGSNYVQLPAAADQSAILANSQWHHIAFVRDDGGNGTIYLDGTAVGSGTGMNLNVDSSPQPLWIGGNSDGNYFNGAIARVQTYVRAISSDEVAQLYNQDSDGDGIPDWWETLYGLNPQNPSDANAPAVNNDGLTNLENYQLGLNPQKSVYNGTSPGCTVTGSYQNGANSTTYAAPVTVVLADSQGRPLCSAPVVLSTGTNLSTAGINNACLGTADGAGIVVSGSSSRILCVTDSTGTVSAYLASSSSNSPIYALAGTAVTALNETQLLTIAEWNFDEGTGTTTSDASRTGNVGALTGAVTWTTGFDGNGAISLDGSSGYVQTPTYSFPGSAPATINTWIQLPRNLNLATSSQIYPILTIGNSGTDSLWFGLCGQSGQAGIVVSGYCVPQAMVFSSGVNLTDTMWHNIGVVLQANDSGITTVTVFVDGKAVGSQQNWITSFYGSTLCLAKDSAGNFLRGNLDNTQIQTIALDASGISALYNVDSTGSGLPDWWKWQFYQDLTISGTDVSASGLTNQQAFAQGVNPTVSNAPYGGQAPTLTKRAGDNQIGFPNSLLPNPLTVVVTGTSGAPLIGVPVTFSTQQGDALLTTDTASSSLVSTVTVQTGIDGSASMNCELGTSGSDTIQVTAGTATPANFSATASSVTLVGLWNLNEGSGTVVHDASGQGNTASISGTSLWTTGYDGGGALDLFGQTGCITVPSSPSLNFGTGPFTFLAWIRLSPRLGLSDTSAQYVLLNCQSQAGTQLQLNIAGGSYNGLRAAITDSEGNVQDVYAATNYISTIRDGNWHQVGLVRDQSMTCILYIDGTEISRKTMNAIVINADSNLLLGTGSPGNHFVGIMDKIELYRSAQSASAISADYNTSTAQNGMPDWWQFKYFSSITMSGTYVAAPGALTCQQAYNWGTNPNSADSDNDGIPDVWAVAYGLNPLGFVSPLDFLISGSDTGYTNLVTYLANPDPTIPPWYPTGNPPPVITVDINGSGDYTSIQQAINNLTCDYQKIVVLPGTYYENITLSTYKFYLVSQVAGGAVIDAGSNGPGLDCGVGGVLQGFWISNAVSGGATAEVGANITFVNCYFANDDSGYNSSIINNGGNIISQNSVLLNANSSSVQQNSGSILTINSQ